MTGGVFLRGLASSSLLLNFYIPPGRSVALFLRFKAVGSGPNRQIHNDGISLLKLTEP